MKKIFFTFFLISVSFLFSQKKNKFDYELLGTLILDSKNLISYKLTFDVDKKGTVNGYSYTDMGGEYETKSYIKGSYNKKSRKIDFYEEDVLYTKAKFAPSDFCFVNFIGKFKIKNRKKVLNGDFVGIYDDKDTCATGKLKLVDMKFTEKKVKKLYKKISKIKRVDSVVKKSLKPKNYLKKFSETRIKSGEDVYVYVYNSKMKMEIWDYGKEDGDIISVSLNNNIFLDNYSVKKKKQKSVLNLIDGENVVEIRTIDAGKLETNTAKIKIYDFKREYEIISDLEVGKSAKIHIIKMNPKK